MAKFKAGGIEYILSLNVAMMGRVKNATGVSAGTILTNHEEFANIMMIEPATLVNIAWICCGEQCKSRDVTYEMLAEAFDGDTTVKFIDALVDASTDFFHSARGKEAIKKELPRAMAMIANKANAAVTQMCDAMESETQSITATSLPAS